MAIHNLFPIPVGLYNLARDLTQEEMAFIQNQEKMPNMGNLTSTNTQVLDDGCLANLRQFVKDSVDHYFSSVYKPSENLSLELTQSWCNYTGKNQWHHKHTHANSFVSGVFYPRADRTTDKIYFYKDGPIIFNIPHRNEDWNNWNSDSWWFEVGTGDLMLFPSTLLHMVAPVEAEETRISLSFNTFPVGILGTERSLSRLVISSAKGCE